MIGLCVNTSAGWNVTSPTSPHSHWIKAGLERNTSCVWVIGWDPPASPPPSSYSRAVVSLVLSRGFVCLRQNNGLFVTEMTPAIPLSLGEGRAVCWEGHGVVVKTGRTRLRNLESRFPSPAMKHIPELKARRFCAGLWPAHSRKHCLFMNHYLKMQRVLGRFSICRFITSAQLCWAVLFHCESFSMLDWLVWGEECSCRIKCLL